ncbi:MAG: DoxX family protein [Rhizobacter sp.]|nr:DoxX family protein [Chlorobiales bacterium]
MNQYFGFFIERREYAAIFIRLIVGFHLIYGVMDNVLSWDRMLEFTVFLEARQFPLPLAGAVISVWVQFIAAVLIIIGFQTRLAALLLIVNFIAAIIIAHIGDAYPNMFPALLMLAAGCFFLFHGAGKVSIDDWLETRAN